MNPRRVDESPSVGIVEENPSVAMGSMTAVVNPSRDAENPSVPPVSRVDVNPSVAMENMTVAVNPSRVDDNPSVTVSIELT